MNKDQFLLRMKAIVLWLSILLFGCHLLYAQDEKAENSLGLQYGIHFLSRQDQLFSPMVYHAVSPLNGNLNFMNQKENRIHWAELEFNLYDLKGRIVYSQSFNMQTKFLELNISKYREGIYIYVINCNDLFVTSGKLAIIQ